MTTSFYRFIIKKPFQSHRANYGVALFLLAYDALNSFGLIFISCELGQRMSDAFNEFNDVIDQSKWYLFPNKLKRILPTIMVVSQEPFVFECFGGISCCREVFQNVRYTNQLNYFTFLVGLLFLIIFYRFDCFFFRF